MKKIISELKHYLTKLDSYIMKQKGLDERWKNEGPGRPLRYPRGEFPRLEPNIKELSQEERVLLKLMNELTFKLKNFSLILEALNPYLRERIYLNDPIEKVDKIFSHEKIERAVMYTDIRGFTKATAQKDSAFNTSHDLARYFSEIFPVSIQRNGQVEYLAGDAQIVSFRNPYDALHTAMFTLKRANELKKEIGVGLNYGEVFYPDLGCDYYKVYSIIGDTVNMAQRMEELTKKFATPIIGTLDFYLALEKTSKTKLQEVFCREFISDVEIRGAVKPKRLFDLYYSPEKDRSLPFYKKASLEIRKVKPDWLIVQKELTQALNFYSEDKVAELYRNFARKKYQDELNAHEIISDDKIVR